MEWMTGPPKAQMYRDSCKKRKSSETFDRNQRDCYGFSLKMMHCAQKTAEIGVRPQFLSEFGV